MTIYIYVLTNYVPAVAVIRKRLVLFIFNRFKGYSGGFNLPKLGTIKTRVLYKKIVLMEERWNSLILAGLVKAKAIFYVKTDAEGRRHRARTGLGTPVVFAENDECHRLGYYLVYKWKWKHFTSRVTWQRGNWNH